MKSLALSAVALSTIVVPALASDLKVVNFKNVQQKPRSKLVAGSRHQLNSRAGSDQVTLINQQDALYVINLKVGSPAQSIAVQIDTGSSDLWFPVTGSNLCAESDGQCNTFGSYNPSKSSPKNLNLPFLIEYGDGTQIEGDFVEDTVQVGSATLTSVQFAACTGGSSSTGIQGILGIGYEDGETTVVGAGSQEPSAKKYNNTVANMVSQGVINSQAYSLWLNDPESADGNVLFGGVDTDKFSGTLISMPVVPDSFTGGFTSLSLPLTAISVSADGQAFTFTASNFASPALIDSGTTLMYLPNDVVSAIWTSLGVVVDHKTPLLPCNIGNDGTAKMTFSFNGPNGASIDVLLNDLLLDAGGTLPSGQEACEFLVSGGGPDGLVILGDAFMRSAYITYDLTNNRIAIAQTKFNVTSSNIQEINSSGIPGASVMSTLVSGLASQTAAATDLPPAQLTGAGAFSTTAGGSTALEATAHPPTFSITGTAATGTSTSTSGSGTHKNAASSVQSPMISIIGALTCTITLMSFLGGAMMVWF